MHILLDKYLCTFEQLMNSNPLDTRDSIYRTGTAEKLI
jgi:hypothetical protein